MAYPQVAATNTSAEASATSTHTVSLPASISSGDLLLILLAIDAARTTTFPAGYTELYDEVDAQTKITLAVAYRVADGGEGATIEVTSSDTGMSAHATYRITGHDSGNPPEISTGASSEDTSPDPDSLTPNGGALEYLWFALVAVDGQPIR